MPLAALTRPLPGFVCNRFRERLYVETDLDRLIALFAAMIAQEGFRGHQVVDRDPSGALVTVFGDTPELTFDGRASVLLVGSVAEPDRAMLLAGDAAVTPSPQTRGFATLYAARGSALLELRSDVATRCPLTLMQRIIFARMLAGEPAIDIALTLGLSTTAVLAHADGATAALEARNSASAVAEAARKGWLAGIPNTFRFQSDKKMG